MFGQTESNFVVQVKGAEMIARFAERAKFHAQRAELHLAKLKEVQKITPKGNEIDNDLEAMTLPERYSNHSSAVSNLENAQDRIKEKIQEHITARNKFQFLAEHVDPNVTQSLSMADLSVLRLLEPISFNS